MRLTSSSRNAWLPPAKPTSQLLLPGQMTTFSLRLRKRMLRWAAVPTAAASLTRMDEGTIRENPILREVRRRLKPDEWDTSQKYNLTEVGKIAIQIKANDADSAEPVPVSVPVFVGGRVDALARKGTDIFVVELKNRANRLFTAVPTYESCQMQAYLAIHGAHEPAPKPKKSKKKEPQPPAEPRCVGAIWCQGYRPPRGELQLEIKQNIKPQRAMWGRVVDELLLVLRNAINSV